MDESEATHANGGAAAAAEGEKRRTDGWRGERRLDDACGSLVLVLCLRCALTVALCCLLLCSAFLRAAWGKGTTRRRLHTTSEDSRTGNKREQTQIDRDTRRRRRGLFRASTPHV